METDLSATTLSRPNSGMTLANRITIARILLIPVFVTLLLYYRAGQEHLRYLALGIFILSVASDAVDGLVARRFKQKTVLGTILDPIADKLLLVSAFICLAVLPSIPPEYRIPVGVLITVISRDIIIVLGAMIIDMIKGKVEIVPTKLGKLTTCLQMATIIAVLLYIPYVRVFWIFAVIFTIISGLNYVVRGSRQLNQHS